MTAPAFRVQLYHTVNAGPPPDLLLAELAFSEADRGLYVGLSDGSSHTLISGDVATGGVSGHQTHDIDMITGLQSALDGKAPRLHLHTIDEVTGLPTALNSRAPLIHSHAIADVSGLQTALDGKAATSHTHEIANVTGLQTALDGKAATSHTHAISNVTGLQTALDGKAATSHAHAITNVTGLQTALDNRASFTDIYSGQERLNIRLGADGSLRSVVRNSDRRISNVFWSDGNARVEGVVDSTAFALQMAGVSDERQKENIIYLDEKAELEPWQDCLEVVSEVRLAEFHWRADSPRNPGKYVAVGVIAQQLETIAPQFIQPLADGTLSVDTFAALPYLLGAVQQLKKRVEALEGHS